MKTTRNWLVPEVIQSFQTLLADLATLTNNTLQPKDGSAGPFELITAPTAVQQRALDRGVPPPQLQTNQRLPRTAVGNFRLALFA